MTSDVDCRSTQGKIPFVVPTPGVELAATVPIESLYVLYTHAHKPLDSRFGNENSGPLMHVKK